MVKRVAILQSHVPEYRVPFFEGLASRLDQEGISVEVYAGTANRRDLARGDSVSPPWLRPLRQREFVVAGRRVVLRVLPRSVLSADLIIAEQARRNLDVYLLLLGRRGRTALWGHGRDFVQEAGRLRRMLLSWLTRRAAHFFAYTEAGAEQLLAAGIPPSRVTTVNNSKETSSGSDDQGPPRATDDPTADRPTIAFVGALDGSKRLDFLVGAMDLVRRHHPDTELRIIGDGPDRRRLMEEYGSEGWIRFTGRLTGEALHRALATSRAIAMPGRVGLVVIDSFAAACPIVTTDHAYHAPEFEYLRDGENALITEDSVDAFAQGLALVLRDAGFWERLQRGCLESSSLYSLPSMVERFSLGVMGALSPQDFSGTVPAP